MFHLQKPSKIPIRYPFHISTIANLHYFQKFKNGHYQKLTATIVAWFSVPEEEVTTMHILTTGDFFVSASVKSAGNTFSPTLCCNRGASG
jgi:hypothetical protein